MVFYRGFCPKTTFYYKGNEIEQCNTFTYLGHVLTTQLSSWPHIQHIISKCNQRIGFLFAKLPLKEIPLGVVLDIFNTYVLPIALYALPFWLPKATEEAKKRLNAVFTKYLKRYLGVPYATHNALVHFVTATEPLCSTLEPKIPKLFYYISYPPCLSGARLEVPDMPPTAYFAAEHVPSYWLTPVLKLPLPCAPEVLLEAQLRRKGHFEILIATTKGGKFWLVQRKLSLTEGWLWLWALGRFNLFLINWSDTWNDSGRLEIVLLQEERIDGRGFGEFRDFGVAFGLQSGTCQAILGSCRCDARILCSLMTPEEDNPHEGNLEMKLKFLSENILDYSQAGVNEMESHLGACFQNSGCIDRETLLIKEGTLAWSLTVEITVLDEGDGGVLDCASLAALGALMDFRLPVSKSAGEEVVILDTDSNPGSPLILQSLPLMQTWVFFNQGLYVLADPRILEMALAQGRIIVGATGQAEISYLEETGSIPADQSLSRFKEVLRKATERSKEVVEHMKLVHGKHDAARSKKYPSPYGYVVAHLMPSRLWKRCGGERKSNIDSWRPNIAVTQNDAVDPSALESDRRSKERRKGLLHCRHQMPVRLKKGRGVMFGGSSEGQEEDDIGPLSLSGETGLGLSLSEDESSEEEEVNAAKVLGLDDELLDDAGLGDEADEDLVVEVVSSGSSSGSEDVLVEGEERKVEVDLRSPWVEGDEEVVIGLRGLMNVVQRKEKVGEEKEDSVAAGEEDMELSGGEEAKPEEDVKKDEEKEELEVLEQISPQQKRKKIADICLSSDSEEEEVITLTSADQGFVLDKIPDKISPQNVTGNAKVLGDAGPSSEVEILEVTAEQSGDGKTEPGDKKKKKRKRKKKGRNSSACNEDEEQKEKSRGASGAVSLDDDVVEFGVPKETREKKLALASVKAAAAAASKSKTLPSRGWYQKPDW
ncbi:unnamed protein product [Cyprideis torosa]|uniref:Uncharacterized protein n=1 Tax=Cyprideis torosa TaxID=163714 RepID=A0A7R8W2J6_9CRUS|nr:unnamed protein product [Cyprideis torosa]CAG0882032.1 unnamed protein product [Cyprideis torosa]